jgi:hypothetical protein
VQIAGGFVYFFPGGRNFSLLSSAIFSAMCDPANVFTSLSGKMFDTKVKLPQLDEPMEACLEQ